jgi:hypothetical protein
MNGRAFERDNGRVCAIHHEGCVGMTVDLHLVSFVRGIHRLGRQRATPADPDLMTLIFELAHPIRLRAPRAVGPVDKHRGRTMAAKGPGVVNGGRKEPPGARLTVRTAP